MQATSMAWLIPAAAQLHGQASSLCHHTSTLAMIVILFS